MTDHITDQDMLRLTSIVLFGKETAFVELANIIKNGEKPVTSNTIRNWFENGIPLSKRKYVWKTCINACGARVDKILDAMDKLDKYRKVYV